ncbi:uncharacterized protein LOC125838412 [Solanum verrucosum]|uniref:uncharacterized protein LOC125838412 n=1 Tax=Solanum verrucosum TaxID=315347 RepID=UPI0020D0EE67|nr:uncharacterized protein LOC125838412 [Solanum verrucosum]
MVTSNLMQMLTARALFVRLASEDPYAHMAKLTSVCKSSVGRPKLDMNVICLRVLPLSLTGDAVVWFSELTYNSIYKWDQLHKVFMARYFLVSKKLNYKDKLNNFAALPRESISSSWDKFTRFMKSVSNHRIDDESLNEYFYQGQDDNGKVVLDTIARESYGSISDIWCQGQGNQGRNYDNYNRDGNYVRDGTYNLDNNYNWNNYGNMNEKVGSYIPPVNREASTSMTPIEDMMQKMIKRFDATNENVKEMCIDLSGINQKVERAIEKDGDENEVTETPKVDTEKEAKVNQNVAPMPRPPPSFPLRLVKKTEEGKYRKFISMLKQLSINVSLIEGLEQMSGYAKFMKDLVTKKRAVNFENEERLQHCSVIATRSLVQKKEDPGAFTIPCTIGILHFAKALYDLGVSNNLMSLSIYKNLGLEAPKPSAMCLQMADRTVKMPIGVLQDVLVKVESFIFLANFMILDCEVDFEITIILGRPFLATGLALVDMERGQMKLRLNNEEVNFNICRSMKHESDHKSVSVVNHRVGQESEVSIEERLGVDALALVIMNFDSDGIDDYDELVAALDRFEFRFKAKWLELDMKNRDTPHTKLSVDELQKLELKVLLSHLRYVFLGQNSTLLVVIVAHLSEGQIEPLISVLKWFKRAIG